MNPKPKKKKFNEVKCSLCGETCVNSKGEIVKMFSTGIWGKNKGAICTQCKNGEPRDKK